MNGNTASFTAKYGGTISLGDALRLQRLARPCSAPRPWPAAAPVALRHVTAPCATRADSLPARRPCPCRCRTGSRTARSSGRRPASSARHRDRSGAAISSCSSADSENGGSEHAESPECTPACSMCSMMPPMTTSVPSQTASTSTSIASFRKRSSSTGLSLRDLHRLAHVALEVASARRRSPSRGRPARSDGRTTSG